MPLSTLNLNIKDKKPKYNIVDGLNPDKNHAVNHSAPTTFYPKFTARFKRQNFYCFVKMSTDDYKQLADMNNREACPKCEGFSFIIKALGLYMLL
jgi:hypothetical protein